MLGHCSDCDQYRDGRIVGDVEQNSGPGRTVVICAPCDARLKARHDRLNRRPARVSGAA
jgi:hypothetical protein